MKPRQPYPWGEKWPEEVGALGPKTKGGRQQLSGACVRDPGITRWHRLIDLSFPEPMSGIIIVQSDPPGAEWRTRLRMGSALGGPSFTQSWNGERVALSWAGESVTLDVQEGSAVAGRRICAAAGLDGAAADLTAGIPFGAGPAPATVRIQDGALNGEYATVANAVSGVGDALVVAGARVLDGVIAALAAESELLALDDNDKLLTQHAGRAARIRGTLAENAFGAGGTAVLIAAPGAGLASALHSVQFGAPTATTVVTLESPAATVLWSARLILTVVPPPVVFPVPLTGASNGAWVVRSTVASTFSVNGQGFTERVA